jgi:tripartite-type tricarboxylate transporter receptor subunit TctC
MNLSRRRFLRAGPNAAALTLVSRWAQAEGYPVRPVRIIVPWAPGGQTDVIGRILAQELSEFFGTQFYVENMPGAGGTIGVGRAAQSAADGYTALVTDISFVINASLYKKVPYDRDKDFEPVALAVTTTQVLVVTPSMPVQTVKQLVDLVKRNPGAYNYASPGVGTPGHMAGELFRLSAGLDLVQVPFNGAGPAVVSTVAGHTPIAFGSPASTVAQIKDGKLRALAVASRTRVPALPDIPTMAEAGFPDIEIDVWIGVFVPAGTPSEIIAMLNRAIVGLVARPNVRERLATFGFEPSTVSFAETRERIRSDSAKWARVIQDAGIKAE